MGPGDRLPIIPQQWRGRENVKATLVLKGGEQWHKTRWHGFRAPMYLVLTIAWALVGVLRLAGRGIGWWWLMESAHAAT